MTVRREANRVWIEGLASLQETTGRYPLLVREVKTCTFASALEGALSETEHPYTYEQIMALSGLAFRVRWYVDENGPTGCPCSRIGETPDVQHMLSRATGWQFEVSVDHGWDTPQMQQALGEVIHSIDAGRPALVYGRVEDSVLAYGYVDRGQALLLNTYRGLDECPISELGTDPALACILGDYLESPPIAQAMVDVLQQATERWHQERGDVCPTDKLVNGKAALEAWIRFYDMHDELAARVGAERLLFHHLWNFKNLYDARRAAAGFLHRHAALYPDTETDLERASGLYQQEADLLGSAYDDDSTYLGVFDFQELDVSRWTPQRRAREAQIMRDALALETSAVEAMRSALPQMALSDET
jgi:hypothetical protein